MTEPRRRGLYFPPGLPRINRAHRLAYGLCFVTLGQAGTILDLVSGRITSVGSSASAPVIRPTIAGQAVFFGNSAPPADAVPWSTPTKYSPIVTSNGSGTGDFTMLAVANPSSNASQQNFIFCQRNNSSLVQAFLAANRNLSAQSQGVFSFGTYNGTFVGATASSAVDGAWHTFMGTRSGTACSVWKDGTQIGTGSGTAQQVSDSGTYIGYGALIDDLIDNTGANCGIAFCAAWNRTLAADESVEVGLDPGSFLVWPDDDFWATLTGPAAVAGGNNYMPFFAPRPF